MKTNKVHLRLFASFLTLSMLVQGCVVYKSANVSIEEASQPNVKVRVKGIDDKFTKFNRLEVIEGKIYGVKGRRARGVKTLIEKDSIKKIQLKDKSVSTLGNILISVATISVLTIQVENSIDIGFGN